MKYKFNLSYSPTVATVLPIRTTRVCFPLHNDDLAVSIDRADGEWYYTRQLEGNLVFVGGDYSWIMALPFDGTFTINIQQSTDGTTYYDYFSATFSRASLEIDEDNHRATLSGLKEGITDLVKNGAKEEYDLMKLIPDSYAKEVQGQVPPALAMVDYNAIEINKSDVFANMPIVSGGYSDTGFDVNTRVTSDENWTLIKIYAEAKVELRDHYLSHNDNITFYDGYYAGFVEYKIITSSSIICTLDGTLYRNDGFPLVLKAVKGNAAPITKIEAFMDIPQVYEATKWCTVASTNEHILSPSSASVHNVNIYKNLNVFFHYIRATLLTQSADGVQENVLDTGDYYKGMAAFNNSDEHLTTYISTVTSEQPNGHRMIAGSADYGGTPQYFAPPDDERDYIPLAEDNWNYASMWYTIEPSVENGLLDPAKFGSFRWTRCWTIGTCIQFLLQRITDGKVVFAESPDYSQFLYGNPNPVEGHEPFQWLVTQKSNVMRPSTGGASAARCPVKLEWFFELLRNAFNCYYWFEKVNGGTYNFRIEHVEYFRRGGAYQGDLADQLDLTRLKPVRNFLRNGQPTKRYADQTNKYTFDLDGMVEKYTYSWQGDGGGDDFKGNPMYFRAGWIEKGSSDDRQVDNIFADLGWLMLNAGTDTASSKNYDGLFIFGGYQPYDTTLWLSPQVNNTWKEHEAPLAQYLVLAEGQSFRIGCDVWMTIPQGETVYLKYERVENPVSIPVKELIGTGYPQVLTVDEGRTFPEDYRLMVQFPVNYSDITIHRLHARSGNVFRVPNVRNMLRPENTLQNGVLAWPWLQCEYLHYDIPAAKWTYLKDEYTDGQTIVWEETGTIKMVKKQNLAVVPVPDASTEDAIMGIMGVKTGLGTGIIDNAKINLSSRNAEMTIIYDINPNNN